MTLLQKSQQRRLKKRYLVIIALLIINITVLFTIPFWVPKILFKNSVSIKDDNVTELSDYFKQKNQGEITELETKVDQLYVQTQKSFDNLINDLDAKFHELDEQVIKKQTALNPKVLAEFEQYKKDQKAAFSYYLALNSVKTKTQTHQSFEAEYNRLLPLIPDQTLKASFEKMAPHASKGVYSYAELQVQLQTLIQHLDHKMRQLDEIHQGEKEKSEPSTWAQKFSSTLKNKIKLEKSATNSDNPAPGGINDKLSVYSQILKNLEAQKYALVASALAALSPKEQAELENWSQAFMLRYELNQALELMTRQAEDRLTQEDSLKQNGGGL